MLQERLVWRGDLSVSDNIVREIIIAVSHASITPYGEVS